MPKFFYIPRMQANVSQNKENFFNPFSLEKYFSVQRDNFENTTNSSNRENSLLKEQDARSYFEDLKRISIEQVGVLSKEELALASLTHEINHHSSDFLSLPNNISTTNNHLNKILPDPLFQSTRNPFSPHISIEEAREIDDFLQKSISDKEQIKTIDEKTTAQQNTNNNNNLLDLQTFLLIAYLQEEQDRELFILEQSIQTQDDTIQGILHNPLEKRYFSESTHDNKDTPQHNIHSLANETNSNNIHKILQENAQETQKSFSFQLIKERKNLHSPRLKAMQTPNNIIYNTQDIPYTSTWQNIFSAQIPFLPEHVQLIVNDNKMKEDLLHFAKNFNHSQEKSHENHFSLEILPLNNLPHEISLLPEQAKSINTLCNTGSQLNRKYTEYYSLKCSVCTLTPLFMEKELQRFQDYKKIILHFIII